MICTQFPSGHLSVRVGDTSRRSEIVKKLELCLSMRLLVLSLLLIYTFTFQKKKQTIKDTDVCHEHHPSSYHLVGLVVKASASRAEDPRFKSRLHQDFFGSSHTSDLPGVIGSVLGLVGLVSVHCDWVRLNVWSATSVCQHVKLSVQIRPWDTLACCWDVKQATNHPAQAATVCEEAVSLPQLISSYSLCSHSPAHIVTKETMYASFLDKKKNFPKLTQGLVYFLQNDLPCFHVFLSDVPCFWQRCIIICK